RFGYVEFSGRRDQRYRDWMDLFLNKEAEFAVRALGPELAGEVDGCTGAGGNGGMGQKSTQGKEAGGLVEAEAGSQLAGGGAEDATAKGGVEGAEAVELDGHGGLAGGGTDRAASTANRLTGQKKLWKQAT